MDSYVIRCLDCLMFGIPIPPDTKCNNCHSRVTEKWIDPEIVESLRQEIKRLTKLDELHQKTATPTEFIVDLNNSYKREIDDLRDKLKEQFAELTLRRQETVMANEYLTQQLADERERTTAQLHDIKELHKVALEEKERADMLHDLLRLSQEEMERLKEKLMLANDIADFLDDLYKQAPTLREEGLENFDGYFVHWDEIQKTCQSAWQFPHGYSQSPIELIREIINERDAAKDEAMRLFSPMPCGHPWACFSPLGSADNESKKDELPNCLTCRATTDLQAELASLREVAKAVKDTIWRSDNQGWRGAQNKVENLISSHESKWPVKKEG